MKQAQHNVSSGAQPRKSGVREFVIDTVVVGVTQLLLKLRALATLPLIVRLLGTASYGIWSQTMTFVSLSCALLGLNLHLPLVRFVASDARRAPAVYASLLTASVLLAIAGGGVLALLADPLSSTLMGASGLGEYVRIGLLLVVVANIRSMNLNVYRAMGYLRARSVIELATTSLELAGIFVVLQAGGTLVEVLLLMATWEGVVAVGTTAHCVTIAGWTRPEWRVCREALAYTLPLLPAALASWALDRADRFVIGHYLGLEGVGIYSANYALAAMLIFFQAPFQMTLLPKVASLWDTDRELARKYIELSIKAFLTFAIPFALGVPALAPFVLRHLGNSEIADASGLITFLISAGVLLWGVGSMQFQVFHGARRTGAIGAVTLAAAALNLVLNFILVPSIGVAGAAVATLVAYGVVCATMILLSRNLLRLDFFPRYIGKCIVAAAAMHVLMRRLAPASLAGFVGVALAGIMMYFLVLLALRGFTSSELARGRSLVWRFVRRRS